MNIENINPIAIASSLNTNQIINWFLLIFLIFSLSIGFFAIKIYDFLRNWLKKPGEYDFNPNYISYWSLLLNRMLFFLGAFLLFLGIGFSRLNNTRNSAIFHSLVAICIVALFVVMFFAIAFYGKMNFLDHPLSRVIYGAPIFCLVIASILPSRFLYPRMNEAKANLYHLYTVQKAYYDKNGRFLALQPMGRLSIKGKFICTLDHPLDFKLDQCEKGRFQYSVEISTDGQSFIAKAISFPGEQHSYGPNCLVEDIWTITDQKILTHVTANELNENC